MSTNTAMDDIKARTEGHTEGPWFAHQDFIDMGVEDATKTITNSPERYAGKFIASVGLDSDVKSANAELMAAAPKLLAALKAVEALAENMAAADAGLYDDDFNRGHCAGYLAAARLARTAIQEALS